MNESAAEVACVRRTAEDVAEEVVAASRGAEKHAARLEGAAVAVPKP
jgi:hypothetical protein